MQVSMFCPYIPSPPPAALPGPRTLPCALENLVFNHPSTSHMFSPPLVDRMWLQVYYNKIPIYPYSIYSRGTIELQGLGLLRPSPTPSMSPKPKTLNPKLAAREAGGSSLQAPVSGRITTLVAHFLWGMAFESRACGIHHQTFEVEHVDLQV